MTNGQVGARSRKMAKGSEHGAHTRDLLGTGRGSQRHLLSLCASLSLAGIAVASAGDWSEGSAQVHPLNQGRAMHAGLDFVRLSEIEIPPAP